MALKSKISIPTAVRQGWQLKRKHGDITAIYSMYKDSDTPIYRDAIKEALNTGKAIPIVITKITEFYEKAI